MQQTPRTGAVKAKTAAANTLQAVLVTAPEPLRGQLRQLSTAKLIDACLRLRPDTANLHDPVQAAKLSLRSIATRARALDTEARELNRQLDALTAAAAPTTSEIFGLGPDTVSALLIAIGDNPDRLRSEAAFAHLCGVAPIPPRPVRPTATGYTAAATDPATALYTLPSSSACATTRAAAPTPSAAPPKANRCPRSSAVKSATSPAKSSPRSATTTPPSPLDDL